MHNSNNRSLLSLDNTANCTHWNLRELMVINSTDINKAMSAVNDTHISTCQAAIATTIDK